MNEMSGRVTRELAIFFKENHDTCSNCGHQFADRETQHLGFDAKANYANVCNDCQNILVETAARYAYLSRPYQIPKPDDHLWRYMDFSKYVSMLVTQSLYFSAAAYFNDPFEGAKGIKKREQEWKDFYYNKFVSVSRTSPTGENTTLTEQQTRESALRLLEAFQQFGESSREATFINCWHLSNHESEAMWSLYSKDREHAIAILTTYSRLYHALNRDPLVDIGKVNYIDYSNTFVEVNSPFWYKRLSFGHENEVRAVYTDYDLKETKGVLRKVDLSVLLEAVIVAPTSSDDLVEVLKDVTAKYGIHPTIKKSSLSEKPFY